MIKASLVFVLAFLFAAPLFAQQVDTAWVRRYNGPGDDYDEALAIAVDGSGNIYVTGLSSGTGTSLDYCTIKYFPNGDTAWVRRYNGLGNSEDSGLDIAVDGSGNVYVTGVSVSPGGNTSLISTIKYYPNGDTAWIRTYNEPHASEPYAMAVDRQRNVYVTGLWNPTDEATDQDYITIKYDSLGNEVWIRTYNGIWNNQDGATAITVDDYGNAYVTGYSMGNGTWYDYATIKYYPNGDSAWVRTYNGPGGEWDVPLGIAVDGPGNVYVTGGSRGSGTDLDYATIKYYPNGDSAWVRRYDGPGNDYDEAWAITVDGSGNVYVTGASYGSGTYSDYATIKYYPNGDTGWVRRYNGLGNITDVADAIAVDGSGNVYVTGWSYASGTDADFATIKYYPNGDTGWVRRYDGPVNNEEASAIAVDGSGNVYVTGWSDGSLPGGDYATIKYWQSYPPDTFSLVSPFNDTIIYRFPIITFDWTSPVDPDPWDTVRYDLYISTSSVFHPESTLVHTNLWTSEETDTLSFGKYLWKVRAYDNHLSTWSNQTWRLNLCMTGDGNCDCRITVSDVVYLINFLFKGGSPPCALQAGDTNCDRWVTVSDIVYLINYLFKGGPPPCEPQ